MKPITRYTKSGSLNIAYQVFGSGELDLVYIPGWVSNIDLMWACPSLVDFLLELSKQVRVILFDKDGTGLSDRVVEYATLEERMDDIRAVMDAVGSEKAILFGHSEGGSVSALFAATYPNRTKGMIAFGIFAKRRYSIDYPWAPTDVERQKVYNMIEHGSGSGAMNLESLAPSKAQDAAFMNWLANYFRSGASPSAAMILTKMNTQVDIIGILDSVNVPVLILQRKNDIDVKIEEGRFIANRIPNAKMVELDGEDHLFWAGNTDEVLIEMQSFITDLSEVNQNSQVNNQRLYTILFGEFNASNSPDGKLTEITHEFLSRGGGSHIEVNEGHFRATFDGPSKAIKCAEVFMVYLNSLMIKTGMFVDMREGYFDGSFKLSSQNQQVIEILQNEMISNGILTTNSVRFLLSGVDFELKAFKDVLIPGVKEKISLYEVCSLDFESNEKGVIRDDDFLDEVLQTIEENYLNENFNVDFICKTIGISERQLQRKLKALTHKSPVQLIMSVKLQKARNLMQHGQFNISEIAYQSGFSNPSYFATCFKKEFGLTPTHFLSGK